MSRFSSQGPANREWAQKSNKTNRDFKKAAAGKTAGEATDKNKGDVAKVSLDREPSIADKKAGAAFDAASHGRAARQRPARSRGRSKQRGMGLGM